jgi:hypothetical protein
MLSEEPLADPYMHLSFGWRRAVGEVVHENTTALDGGDIDYDLDLKCRLDEFPVHNDEEWLMDCSGPPVRDRGPRRRLARCRSGCGCVCNRRTPVTVAVWRLVQS